MSNLATLRVRCPDWCLSSEKSGDCTKFFGLFIAQAFTVPKYGKSRRRPSGPGWDPAGAGTGKCTYTTSSRTAKSAR